MKITKHNISESISKYLKQNRINYLISDESDKGVLYELLIGYRSAFIQIEYELSDDNDDDIELHLFIDNENDDMYYSDISNEEINSESLENEIEQLIDATKALNRAVAKISSKIEQIRDICDEYNLDIEMFITLNYNFNE
jgi:hypothetical protein